MFTCSSVFDQSSVDVVIRWIETISRMQGEGGEWFKKSRLAWTIEAPDAADLTNIKKLNDYGAFIDCEDGRFEWMCHS